jgi:hypothetical protein
MQVMQSITAREMNQEKRQELMINAGRTDQNTRTIENSSPRRQANQKWLRQKEMARQGRYTIKGYSIE